MSRILLLLIFLLWMTGTADGSSTPPDGVWLNLALFIGGYGLLVLGLGLWSRMLARRVASQHFHRGMRRFNNAMLTARLLVPVWFVLGMSGLGWAWIVQDGIGAGSWGTFKLPGLLIGTLPAVLTWIGLWWSQFPAERALREQHVLLQLEEGTPLHAPPTFGEYVSSNLRLQVLFTLVPVLLIVLVRDVVAWGVFGHYPGLDRHIGNALGDRHGAQDNAQDFIEFATFLIASGMIFIVAPEILRRVLKTSPLPDGPLRRRLDAMCRRTGVRCRNILVWHTQYNMGNAAVMGVIPSMRYVLLSDLLLERMDDDQIEAVFAHEAGHVVHRHMIWYVVFFLILMVGSIGTSTITGDWIDHLNLPHQVLQHLSVLAGAGGFCLLFGYLSRRFERQADVYAARVIESARAAPLIVPAPGGTGSSASATSEPRPSHVGPYGATLFASALHRVAIINNIPVSPRSRRDGSMMSRMSYVLGSFLDLAHDWLHGSIPHRMAYLHGLSADPALTTRFDRVMARLYLGLLFAFFASLAWTGMVLVGSR